MRGLTQHCLKLCLRPLLSDRSPLLNRSELQSLPSGFQSSTRIVGFSGLAGLNGWRTWPHTCPKERCEWTSGCMGEEFFGYVKSLSLGSTCLYDLITIYYSGPFLDKHNVDQYKHFSSLVVHCKSKKVFWDPVYVAFYWRGSNRVQWNTLIFTKIRVVIRPSLSDAILIEDASMSVNSNGLCQRDISWHTPLWVLHNGYLIVRAQADLLLNSAYNNIRASSSIVKLGIWSSKNTGRLACF